MAPFASKWPQSRAIFKASMIRFVCMWLAIDQPTTIRVHTYVLPISNNSALRMRPAVGCMPNGCYRFLRGTKLVRRGRAKIERCLMRLRMMGRSIGSKRSIMEGFL